MKKYIVHYCLYTSKIVEAENYDEAEVNFQNLFAGEDVEVMDMYERKE